MNATLTRLMLQPTRRVRLQLAEQDLATTEHYAAAAIEQKRAVIVQLRRAIDRRSTDDVRRDIERAAKAQVLQ